jgi:hypothetical protein
MDALGLALQTAYADLIDKLLDDRLHVQARLPGNFVVHVEKGRRYWYRQFRDPVTGKRKQASVGPETPDLLARIARHRALVETDRARRDIVRALTRTGAAPAPTARVGRVLEALAAAGVFRLRAVLVGTAAFQAYGPLLGIRLGSRSITTEDIDVAQFRSVSVAVDDSVPPMLDALRAIDPAFQPISKALHGQAPIAFAAGDLKFEFLTPMRGPVEDAPVRLPALGTSSQPLRFLDYLICREQVAAILHGAGVLVNVPDPARYAWHKLIVSQRRTVNQAKARKDVLQAEVLFEALAADKPGDVRDMWAELSGPGRVRWQEIARAGLQRLRTPVRDRVLTLIS